MLYPLSYRGGAASLLRAAVRTIPVRTFGDRRRSDHSGQAVRSHSARRHRSDLVDRCMLICMQSTSVRIDVSTHDELKRLAAEFDTTVGNTVALAVRALRQDHIGDQLQSQLRDDETAWLDAELG